MFSYALNEKRTKKNLLKGAKKSTDLEVEVKSGNTNLRFSDGSYLQVVLPLLKSLQGKINETHHFSENEIKIVEFEAGKDISEKHVDTKLAVMFNDCRLVLHAYNSTQNLMVQGKSHEHFAVKVLEPYFREKIKSSIDSKENIFIAIFFVILVSVVDFVSVFVSFVFG